MNAKEMVKYLAITFGVWLFTALVGVVLSLTAVGLLHISNPVLQMVTLGVVVFLLVRPSTWLWERAIS